MILKDVIIKLETGFQHPIGLTEMHQVYQCLKSFFEDEVKEVYPCSNCNAENQKDFCWRCGSKLKNKESEKV